MKKKFVGSNGGKEEHKETERDEEGVLATTPCRIGWRGPGEGDTERFNGHEFGSRGM